MFYGKHAMNADGMHARWNQPTLLSKCFTTSQAIKQESRLVPMYIHAISIQLHVHVGKGAREAAVASMSNNSRSTV